MVQKYAIFIRKSGITLNITYISEIHHKFSDNAFHGLQQNSKHLNEHQIIHTSLKIKTIKVIEHQIHKSKFGELFYQYFSTTVSTQVCLVQINPFTNIIS